MWYVLAKIYYYIFEQVEQPVAALNIFIGMIWYAGHFIVTDQ